MAEMTAKVRNTKRLGELLEAYKERKGIIKSRLEEFRRRRSEPVPELFGELCFCLFTPQSKAVMCDRAVRALKDSGLLLGGERGEIASRMRGVRFRNNKAGFLIQARQKLLAPANDFRDFLAGSEDNRELREWLVKNIKGLGYKESSHFLRNIGLGDDLAILDRHILRNLVQCGVIAEVPKSLTKRKYLKIESQMLEFSEKIGIPIQELDLLFWSMETGEVFK